MHGSGFDEGALKGIGQVRFAARDEFDLCLRKFAKHREVDVAFVENEQAASLQNRQNIRPETLIVCF